MVPPIPPRFSVTFEATPGSALVTILGEVDLDTASEVEAALQRALEADLPVVVDLDGCTFIDSTGLQRLLRAREAAARAERPFVLVTQEESPAERIVELVAPGLFDVARSTGEALGPR